LRVAADSAPVGSAETSASVPCAAASSTAAAVVPALRLEKGSSAKATQTIKDWSQNAPSVWKKSGAS
jgi:hypothetical protein